MLYAPPCLTQRRLLHPLTPFFLPPEPLALHFAMQVFNCTPQQLLPLVRAELERLLHQSPSLVEGYIRPGVRGRCNWGCCAGALAVCKAGAGFLSTWAPILTNLTLPLLNPPPPPPPQAVCT